MCNGCPEEKYLNIFIFLLNSFTKWCKWMCVYSWRNSWVLPPTLLCHLSVRFSLLLSCTITSMICCALWYKVRDNTVHKMSLSTMFSLLMAVVWSQVGGDKQLLGTGLCIFRVPRLLPEWCHQCCRMANCDEMQRPLHVRPFLGEVLCVLLCLYISQSLNPLKFCCISHTHTSVNGFYHSYLFQFFWNSQTFAAAW